MFVFFSLLSNNLFDGLLLCFGPGTLVLTVLIEIIRHHLPSLYSTSREQVRSLGFFFSTSLYRTLFEPRVREL